MWLLSLTPLKYSSPSRKERCPTVFTAISTQRQEQQSRLQVLRSLFSLISCQLKQLPWLFWQRGLLCWASKVMHTMGCWQEGSSAVLSKRHRIFSLFQSQHSRQRKKKHLEARSYSACPRADTGCPLTGQWQAERRRQPPKPQAMQQPTVSIYIALKCFVNVFIPA